MSNPKTSSNNNVATVDQSIADHDNGENKEKRKPSGWDIASVISGFISVIAAIWIGIFTYNGFADQKKSSDEGAKIAQQALQKAEKANEISEKSQKDSEIANELSRESNEIAKESRKVSEEANKLARIANEMERQSNIKSEVANELSKKANDIAQESLISAKAAAKVSKEMEKLARQGNLITDNFNRVQYNIQRAHLLKEGKELFDSEKAVCCTKIIKTFHTYFYLMADLSPQKIDQFFNFYLKPLDGRIKISGITDPDELCVLETFLKQVNEECSPLKYGFTNTKEAVEYYLNLVFRHNDMVALYGMNPTVDAYSFYLKISDREYFMSAYLDKDIMMMLYEILPENITRGWNFCFNNILKDKKEYRKMLLKYRDEYKKETRDFIKEVNKMWFVRAPGIDAKKAIIAYSEKNDRRFQQQKKK